MGRAKLGAGEVGNVWFDKVDGGWRAFARTRLHNGRRVQVQAFGTSQKVAREAVAARAKERAMQVEDGLGPLSTLAYAAEEYIASRQASGAISATTARDYRDDVKRATDGDGIGGVELRHCTPRLMSRFLMDMAAAKPSAAKRLRHVLDGTFNYVYSMGVRLDDPNPVERLQLVPPRSKPARAVDDDELAALRQRIQLWQAGGTAGGRQRWPFMSQALDVFLGSGCRIGELLALRWQDIDLASTPPTITTAGTVVRIEVEGSDTSKLIRKDTPKTKKSYRTIPLPPFAVDALRHMSEHGPTDGSGLVFPSATGGVMCPRNFSRRWREIRGEEYAWVTAHSFRRTVLTTIEEARGRDAAQSVAGHERGETTEGYVERRAYRTQDASSDLEKLGPRGNVHG